MFGEILLKDNGVEDKIDKIDGKAQKTHKSFGSMIGTAAKWGGALTLAVGGVALASIKDAAEAEASLAQLDAVLKSTGGTAGVTRKQLTDLADGLEKTTKFSAESTQAAQALLLTFTNIGKDVFPQATRTALDMATALGGEPKDQAIALGKALNDPIKGVTALTKVGVSFTEEQKKSIKAMQEHGDMAGAQKIILAELAKEFGGSAEAAGKTFAGQLIIAKNAMGNVTETLGTVLLPKLTEFLNWVTPHLPAIGDFFAKAFDVVGKVLSTVGTYVQENIMPIFKQFYDWIVPHIPEIKQFMVDMVDIVVPKFQKIVDIVKEIAGKIFPGFKDGTKNISDEVKSFTNTALSIVIAALTWVRDNIPLVKGVLAALTVTRVIHKGVVLAHNIALLAHNIHLAYTNTLLLIASARTTAASIAHGIYTIAVRAGSIAMAAFNLVMSLNPIVLVIASLALLGLAIYKVVKHWDGITSAITKAWNALKFWNNTPAKDKSSTVTTNYRDTGQMLSSHGNNAAGTDFWRGGTTWVGEKGPELVNLPRGSQVIPNDESMAMAKGGITQNITINSPIALSPSETARQLRYAQQQFALQL